MTVNVKIRVWFEVRARVTVRAVSCCVNVYGLAHCRGSLNLN